ncbi:pyrroline-5-carboxylate reductase [Schlesneria paludicola]|uniref:pyrroline-5-carboxylate reductase n=1 Tax=Schlesneria paludicola TaxID=360056 RepID=UPI00029A2FD0|nr:pyrroline-5-carboxylate reductase [Schlesneria paludicola]
MSDAGSGLSVGFIGAGQMATALAKGFIAAGSLSRESIVACDVVAAAGQRFVEQTGARLGESIAEVASASSVIFLAVKPQQMSAVFHELRHAMTHDPLIVSIAAGVTLKSMSAGLREDVRMIRVMPNTPCLVGAGASAFARGPKATAADGALVQKLLSNVGLAVEVPEKLLDAVTGLSGSGPAYIYQIIEALSDGGVRMGLPRETATKLAAQTVAGAAQMVLMTGQHPGALKDAVTSPGGTTIAGLHALERGGLRGTLMNAVQAATERARELDAS